jgi:hypothetical protein
VLMMPSMASIVTCEEESENFSILRKSSTAKKKRKSFY